MSKLGVLIVDGGDFMRGEQNARAHLLALVYPTTGAEFVPSSSLLKIICAGGRILQG